MIRKGTRVKIVEVGENDAFRSSDFVGRSGVTTSTLRDGGDEFYYGGILLDLLPGSNFQNHPWFGYVKVEVIRKRRKNNDI